MRFIIAFLMPNEKPLGSLKSLHMHELSIVLNIIEIANDELHKHQAQIVEAIELEVGELAGIEFTALDFAWNAAVEHTILQNAIRTISQIEGKARCSNCGNEFGVFQRYEPCPVCGEVFNEIISGQELKVKSLILS